MPGEHTPANDVLQRLGYQQGQVFMGRDCHVQPDYSDEIAFQIDTEIRRIVDGFYDSAENAFIKNRVLFDKLAKELIEYETVEAPPGEHHRGVRRGLDLP